MMVPKGNYIDASGQVRCCKCGWPWSMELPIHWPCWDSLDWKEVMGSLGRRQSYPSRPCEGHGAFVVRG
jgi:hypothetical protein